MKKKILLFTVATLILAAAHPAEAQRVGKIPGKIPGIGFLFSGDPSESSARIEAFRQGRRELGYVEGTNIVLEERSAGEKRDSLSNLAAELVGLKVAAIVTMGTSATRAAKNATGTIPIVMTFVSDPVGCGFVAASPGPAAISPG